MAEGGFMYVTEYDTGIAGKLTLGADERPLRKLVQ